MFLAITIPVAIGVVAATAKGKTSCPSGDVAVNSDGSCQSGYIVDPDYPGCCMPTSTSSNSCPTGDIAANADGSCKTGYVSDPDYSGCCKPSTSVCPNSCSADSDCTGCGQDFVCESGQCVKQIPASVSAPLSANIRSHTDYTTTCCEYVVYSNCLKCKPIYSPGYESDTFPVYVYDKSGRGIPGVSLSIASSVVSSGLGFKFTVTDASGSKQYKSGATATAITDSDGKITIEVKGTTMPVGWGDISSSNYPCSACNATPAKGSQGPLSFGQFSITVLGTSIAPGITLLSNTVSYHGSVVEIGGCTCL